MKNRLATIITPSYNQGKFLEETILSVLNQDYPNIEYFIIDGGSRDNSLDIIKKYENQVTYWESKPDKGQADAINKGLKRAGGDFLCWINSDDILYPNFVSSRIKQFENHPDIDFIYGDIAQGLDYSSGRIRKGRATNFSEMLESLNVPLPQQSCMWRRIATDKTSLLEEKWHVLLDREFFMRFARHHTIAYFPGTVAFFRNHDESKSIAEKIKWAEEIPVLYGEIFNENKYELSHSLLKKKNSYMVRAMKYAAEIARKSGNNALYEHLMKEAVSMSPFGYAKHKLKLMMKQGMKGPKKP